VERQEETEAFDPLRDGPLRFLGYANELGEAFAAWLPPFGVPLSYCIALGYAFIFFVHRAVYFFVFFL
jgi:hypothetical protein